MLLRTLREEVLEANLELVRRGLVLYTFGNVSGIDRAHALVAIKPSGVPYDKLTPEQIVISDLTGKIIDGTLRPSSDLATHLESTEISQASVEWHIRIRNSPPHGPRRRPRFRASGPRTQTRFTVPSRS